MKILVLGGNGFIGSHVVDLLLAARHEVRVFDRADDRYRGRLPGVEYVLGSLDDTFLLSETLSGMDAVFHGISSSVPSTSNLDPVCDIQTNLVGTVNLLRAMIDNQVERIVFLSSGGTVYGSTKGPTIPEDHPLHPLCSYGIVKVAVENYLNMYQHLGSLRPVILRPANPYGERQGHVGVQGVIGTFFHKIIRNERIEIWGDGSIVRDFLYVGDLAKACLRAIESDVCGVFNIGGGRGYSVNEILQCIADTAGVEVHPLFRSGRALDVSKVVLDITRAKAIFDWSPETTLKEGLTKTFAWMNSSTDVVQKCS